MQRKRACPLYPNSDRKSGLPQKVRADMCGALAHVCFRPEADMGGQEGGPLMDRGAIIWDRHL